MAGVLSALGIGLADTTVMREQSVEAPLDPPTMDRVREVGGGARRRRPRRAGGRRGAGDRRSGSPPGSICATTAPTPPLAVELADPDAMVAAFEAIHRRTYSFLLERRLIVEAVSVEATGLTEQPDLTDVGSVAVASATGRRSQRRRCGSGRRGSGARRRCSSAERMPAGTAVTGPAIIAEANATTVVDEGWQAAMTATGHLLVERVQAPAEAGVGTAADPVMLEIFNNLFMSAAEQMGAALESTAQSVNIRERLDFSCALFDPAGNLIANAPHIPVHLGSMGTSVKEVVRRRGRDDQRRATCTRSTTRTTAAPISPTSPSSPRCSGPAPRPSRSSSSSPPAATTPRSAGSPPDRCPPNSRDVHEEGVLFDNWLLVSDGRFREEETRRLLDARRRYPSRAPDTNLGDLRAQVAANARGVEELGKMIDHFGLDVVLAYMGHVQDNAEESVRRVIDALDDGAYDTRRTPAR